MGRDIQNRIAFDDSQGQEQDEEWMGPKVRQCGEQPHEKGKATGQELKELIEKQQSCCALSGLPLTPDTAALDHKVAVSNGGWHNIENLQWLHIDINRMKGSLDDNRFKQLAQLIASNSTPRHRLDVSDYGGSC